MKILIADDAPQRYDRLIDRILDIGIDRDNISVVNSASGARALLGEGFYDLFILDILLPKWPESSQVTEKDSMDLLLEIHQADTLVRPRHIVGITADPEAMSNTEPNFRRWTWTLVEYSEQREEWLDQLHNCITYIYGNTINSGKTTEAEKIDLAIVCALKDPELDQILKLDWNWGVARPIDDINFVIDGWFVNQGKKITVVASVVQRMGMVSTAILSSAIISTLWPRLICMCGICAGVRDKVRVGDVLFADPAWDFQSGKRIKDIDAAKLSIAPHQIPADSKVRSHVQQLSRDNDAMLRIYGDFNDDTKPVPKIYYGPVASGSAVLADASVMNEIREQHRELIGVEMEIYGLFAAAHGSSSPRPRYFALKSVCDYGDEHKDDSSQKYAAFTSARVLQLLMEKYGNRLLE